MGLSKPLKLGAADALLYSQDGKRLAVRSSQLSVWDLEKQTRLWRGNPVPYLSYAAFSPDGKRLAAKSTTGQIAVVNADNGKVVCDFRNKKDDEGCNVLFSSCGKFVIDGTWEGRLLVREAGSGKITFEREFPTEMIHDIWAVDGGSSIVVMHNPKYMNDDREPPPPYVTRWKWPLGAKPTATTELPDQLYLRLALSPDGRFLAFESSRVPKKPTIDIHSLPGGKRVAEIPLAREDRMEQLSWSPDGKYLALVKRDGFVICRADKFEQVVEQALADASELAFSPTGDTIALGSRAATVVPWDQVMPADGAAPKLQAKPKAAQVETSSYIDAPEHQKAFKKVLAAMPSKARVRQLLTELACDDEDRRVAAYERATDFDRSKQSDDLRSPNWLLKENEALAILSAGTIAEFPPPPPDADWKDGYHTALTLLWRSPHPSLLPLVEPAYEKQPRGVRRAALLALLGVLGTREAAETFAACIHKFGWPPLYQRVWWELEKLLAHGEVMLPEIALAAGKEEIGELVETITSALAEGTLKLEKVAGRLDALAPVTVSSIKKLIKQSSKYQTRKGIAWRFGDAYSDARYRLSSLLNLAGYLLDPKLPPLVREAAKFSDPVIAAAAAIALLRQSGDVNKAAIRRAAESHETRRPLFELLSAMDREDLFPKKFATWEAFAASDMARWLIYPTELGREPDQIELGHTEWLDKKRKLAMYVWKFRSAKEPWLAGVSGPYKLSGTPCPAHGPLTFSCFDEWDSATPQKHLEKCAGSANEIGKAHSN
jgi:hypothetical protein